MSIRVGTWLAIGVLLAPASVARGFSPAIVSNDPHAPLKTAIADAVVQRVGHVVSIDVEILAAPNMMTPGSWVATPAPGARLGQQIRFVFSSPKARSFSVVAHVSVIAQHAAAVRPIARDAQVTSEDVEWREGPLDDVLLQRLPSVRDVLNGRPRRALTAGEMITSAVIAAAVAVRAGDPVTVSIKTGNIEAHNVGRAISSGYIGDVIRVSCPGSPTTRRARVMAPALVELLP